MRIGLTQWDDYNSEIPPKQVRGRLYVLLKANYNHMNRWIYLVLILLGCGMDEEIFERNPEGLEGTWKLVESAFSTGAGLIISPVKDGREIRFLPNGTFVMSPREDCGSGFFYFDGEELKLDLFCGMEEQKADSLFYKVEIQKEFIKLIPVSPVCIEGCWFKYKKLAH